ncbi:hypothetical protein V1517DRAFT_334877 [Lipomyces orientalis]|uniref:Uncharacterized protein n=1 Tax=Lipomyces orientalis TaxID=1233043 RepID=A0ACC3TBY2_9ASCO
MTIMDNFDHYEFSESSSAPDSDLFIPDTPTPPVGSSVSYSRKRKVTAMTTWDYSRPAKPNEPERSRDGRNRIFYCKLCLNPSYSCKASPPRDIISVIGIKLELLIPKPRPKGSGKTVHRIYGLWLKKRT